MAEILFSQTIGRGGNLTNAMRRLQDQVLNTIEAGFDLPGLDEDSFAFGHQRTSGLITKIRISQLNSNFDPKELDQIKPQDKVSLTDNGVLVLERADKNSSEPLLNIHDLFDPAKQEIFKPKREEALDNGDDLPAPPLPFKRGPRNESILDGDKRTLPQMELISPGPKRRPNPNIPKIAEDTKGDKK